MIAPIRARTVEGIGNNARETVLADLSHRKLSCAVTWNTMQTRGSDLLACGSARTRVSRSTQVSYSETSTSDTVETNWVTAEINRVPLKLFDTDTAARSTSCRVSDDGGSTGDTSRFVCGCCSRCSHFAFAE